MAIKLVISQVLFMRSYNKIIGGRVFLPAVLLFLPFHVQSAVLNFESQLEDVIVRQDGSSVVELSIKLEIHTRTDKVPQPKNDEFARTRKDAIPCTEANRFSTQHGRLQAARGCPAPPRAGSRDH